MSKPIYGISEKAAGGDCVPQADMVPSLLANASYLMNTLNGSNKSNVLSQLDNIRHQLTAIAGTSARFVPYKYAAQLDTMKVTKGANGKFQIN